MDNNFKIHWRMLLVLLFFCSNSFANQPLGMEVITVTPLPINVSETKNDIRKTGDKSAYYDLIESSFDVHHQISYREAYYYSLLMLYMFDDNSDDVYKNLAYSLGYMYQEHNVPIDKYTIYKMLDYLLIGMKEGNTYCKIMMINVFVSGDMFSSHICEPDTAFAHSIAIQYKAENYYYQLLKSEQRKQNKSKID